MSHDDIGYYSAWITLILTPLTMATGALQIRKHRSMNEYTPNTYATMFGIIVFGIWTLFEEKGF